MRRGAAGFVVGVLVAAATVAVAPVAGAAGEAVFTDPALNGAGGQDYVVTAGVCEVTVVARGAAGGDGRPDGGNVLSDGRAGGSAAATIPVTPGETLHVFVGGKGGDVNGTQGGAGGANGGGDAGNRLLITPTGFPGGGGGGASDVRQGGTALDDRVVVAGGGGGGGGRGFFFFSFPQPVLADARGGAGGGTDGAAGAAGFPIAGRGGTQSGGGTGGNGLPSGRSGTNGTQGVGGNGADGDNSDQPGGGGGGGGGYFGGGGGASGFFQPSGTGGGGGSGFTPDGTGLTQGAGPSGADGQVTITPVTACPSPPAQIAVTPNAGDDDHEGVMVTGSGFPPNTIVTVDIHSTAVVLGTATADANGSFEKAFDVPCGVGAGGHTVTATAETGQQASASVGLGGCAASNDDQTKGYTVIVSFASASPGSSGMLAEGSCTGRLAKIDLENGELDPLPAPATPEACVGDLAFSPDGALYGIRQGVDNPTTPTDAFPELVEFDTHSGKAHDIGRVGHFSAIAGSEGFPIGGLGFDAKGDLYVMVAGPGSTITTVPNRDPRCAGSEINFCLYKVEDPDHPGDAELVGVSSSTTNTGAALELLGTLAASCDDTYAGRLTLDDSGANTAFEQRVSTVDLDDAGLGGTKRLSDLLLGADFADAAFDHDGSFFGITAALPDPDGPPVFHVAALHPDGGDPIDDPGPTIVLPDEDSLLNGLAIEPLDCAPPVPTPAPVVITPTFTG